MKRLIVCCDGTWNAPTDVHDGVPVPTNVAKIANMFATGASAPAGGVEQRVYYHPGVGAGANLLDKIIDGATGRGLGRNVQSAYKWLSHNYAPGDEIFLFGFSRGAFTVRSLSGLLTRCGLPLQADWDVIGQAYDCYRLDASVPAHARRVEQFRSQHPGATDPAIAFLGVWDTVGALGIPRDLDWLDFEAQHFQFHNTSLTTLVKVARHAVAIDEMRANFTPTLWTEVPPERDVVQIWFPGVHGDVGGGYRETGLSDAALAWMVDEARNCGAVFLPKMEKQLHPDVHGVLHNSYSGLFHWTNCQPRPFPRIAKGSTSRDGQCVHDSAAKRSLSPPIAQAPYRPTCTLAKGQSCEVDVFAREVWNWTTVYLEDGASYSFTASGSWQDDHYTCGPGGMSGGLVHWIASASKRAHDAPWFALVGAIGDAGNPDDNGNPQPMTQVPIGAGPANVTVKRGGYLYAFANDMLAPIGEKSIFYQNNRGSVRLHVARTR